MIFDGFTLAGLEPRDVLGAHVAAAAAGVLAGVLLWHALSMARQGRWRHWTCWSAVVLAAVTAVWLIILLTSHAVDNAWTKLILLTLLAIATAVIFYHAVYHYLGPARILLLLALRCLAIIVLVVLLFKPTMVSQAGLRDRPSLIFLIDRSQSMAEADVAEDQGSGGGGEGPASSGPGHPDATKRVPPGQKGRQRPRLEAVLAAIAAEQSRLENFFDVKYYAFDKSAELVEGDKLAELRPTGEGTFLDVALATISPLLDQAATKGTVLISDGNHNGPRPAQDAVALLKKPLVTVCVGGPVAGGDAGRDIEIEQVSAPDQAICKNVAAVNFDVRNTGFAGRQATAVLRQVGGEELARTTVDLAEAAVPVKLEFTPRQVGMMDLELAIGQTPPTATSQADVVPLDGETVAGNNRHTFTVRVGEPRVKVLYVEGRVRPEYRYLVQTLAADPQLELLTLAQVSLPGTAANPSSAVKFNVFGSVGGKQLQGMPATAEQFKLFDVIILGDLDRTYLSDNQMKLMQDWVKEGKGLLMFGGSHSFGPGGYGGTAIEQILPVELGLRTIGQETTPFRLQLTEQGRTHAIFSGLADLISPPPNGPASQLPELTGCVKVLRAKPAGQVLAVHPTRKTPDGQALLPVLTVQGYGSGRSAAFAADTTWNWLLYRTVAAYEGVHQRFWGQLVRWLASSELVDRKQPSAAVLSLPRSYFSPNESIPLTARVWDKDGLPADGCRVTVRVAGANGRPMEIELSAVQGGREGGGSAVSPLSQTTGLYQGILPPQPPGMLQLTLSANKTGVLLGTNERRLEVGLPGAEAISRSANPDLMRALADARPGLVQPGSLPLVRFPQLVDELVAQYQRRPAAEPERLWPSYDNSMHGLAMLVFIGLLSAEWLLRRRWQLQ